MLSTVSTDVVVLTSACSPWSGIGMSRISFIPFEFTIVIVVVVATAVAAAAAAALLSTSFTAEPLTASLDMLFSLTTPPAPPSSFFSSISFNVFSRLCLSLISSAKKLVSVIFSLMSNFFAAPESPEGDRERLPLE